jgi:hypothetical protein
MATTFAWVINQMDTKPQEDGLMDVVVTVHWTRTAEQFVGGEPINVSSYGTMGCTTPSATDFTAYPDLTYDQVCGWLNAGLPVAEIDLSLQSQIDNIINPPIIVLPLPWVPTTTTTTTEAPIV